MKEKIIARSYTGLVWDTKSFEQILQEYIDPHLKMSDVKTPK